MNYVVIPHTCPLCKSILHTDANYLFCSLNHFKITQDAYLFKTDNHILFSDIMPYTEICDLNFKSLMRVNLFLPVPSSLSEAKKIISRLLKLTIFI